MLNKINVQYFGIFLVFYLFNFLLKSLKYKKIKYKKRNITYMLIKIKESNILYAI